jgi:NAD(P)-dependent dehydrogenase (short-subunit alcohol dehydrogenase family)
MLVLHRFQIEEVVGMSSPVVFITGALPGIDRAAAIVFALERAQQGQEAVAELQALGAEVIFVRTDPLNKDEVHNLVDQMVEL